MSDSELPQDVDARNEAGGCLDNLVLRITAGFLLLLGIASLIAFVAYNDTRNDRSQPIEIRHYPGIIQISSVAINDGEARELHEGFFENMSAGLLTDIEAHYSREMDNCFRLSEDLNDPTSFHTIICRIDRSHNWLGFTQFATLSISPQRDENEDAWTGEIVVIVEQFWEN